MNFHIELAGGYAPGVLPQVETAAGWREGAEMFVETAQGWRTVWRRTITFINTVDRSGASIFDLMGQPTKARNYVFINRAKIWGGGGGFALRTGVFPAGSKLLIINEGSIRGQGGKGGGYEGPAEGSPGWNALHLDFPASLANAAGYIFAGGGGGGRGFVSNRWAGGGGGAGVPSGGAGGSYQSTVLAYTAGSPGTQDAGGAPAGFPGSNPYGGAGGAPGLAGSYGTNTSTVPGAPGLAVARSGYALTVLSGGTSDRIKGAIS